MATVNKRKDALSVFVKNCEKQFASGYETTDKFLLNYERAFTEDVFPNDLDLFFSINYSLELDEIQEKCSDFLIIDCDHGFFMTNLNTLTYSIRVFIDALPPLVINIIAKVDAETLSFTFESMDKAQIAKMKSDYTFDFRSMRGVEFSEAIVNILSEYIIRPGKWTYKDPA